MVTPICKSKKRMWLIMLDQFLYHLYFQKNLQKIMYYNRLINFFNQNEFLIKHRFGFRENIAHTWPFWTKETKYPSKDSNNYSL